MYINKTEAEIIFDLIAREDEKLSLGEYRLNFLAGRTELVELLEKIAPTIKADGWTDSPEWTARVHRLALENDLAEKRARKCTQCSQALTEAFKSEHKNLCTDCYDKAED
jgi:hypothetical protein